jgi:2-polyprenyl-6-methoxyphenol hydroxylase-like FAD-dependent oxidoreductase
MTLLGDHVDAAGLDAGQLFAGIADADYVLWAFITRRDNIASDAASQHLRRAVDDRLTGWHKNLRRMIMETDPRTIGAFRFFSAKPPTPWAASNVTLLGDAIHSMTPAGGVGANTALRDASCLCRRLAAVGLGKSELVPAIHAYEQAMLVYGFAAVNKSLERTRQALAGRLARARDRSFLRLCGVLPPLRRAVFRNEWDQAAR